MLCKWFAEFSRDVPRCVFAMHSGLCDWKINRKIPRKNVKHAKVSKNILWFIRNVEFLEVAYIYFSQCGVFRRLYIIIIRCKHNGLRLLSTYNLNSTGGILSFFPRRKSSFPLGEKFPSPTIKVYFKAWF